MIADHPPQPLAPAHKPSFGLFLAGLVLALIAVWMAADGAMNGVLEIRLRGLALHLVANDDPLGFWAAEAAILLFGLFFLAAGFAALRPRRG